LTIENVEPYYLLVVERRNNLDELEVWVEVSEKAFSDEVRKLEQLGRVITKELESSLGVAVKVKLVEPKSLQRSEGKAKRVEDRRQF
ncbi:MAG: phenylacetate--CoA ligase, partial [Bacillota bacterium]